MSVIVMVVTVWGCKGAGDAGGLPPPRTRSETGLEDSGVPDDTGQPGCLETVGEELPSEVEWLTHDGESDRLFSLADEPFAAWKGRDGTYDLNHEEVIGSDAFWVDRPGQVVGLAARWDNLPAEPGAVTLYLWADHGGTGLDLLAEAPLAELTRCLADGDGGEGVWLEYPLPEPLVLDQPARLFAGFRRGTGEDAPELFMENTWDEEPPFSGTARFPDVDDETWAGGWVTPWYVWQVRLAVVLDDPIEQTRYAEAGAVSLGAHVAWGDFDGDGDDDLYTDGPRLYQTQHDGTLVDVTEQNGLGGHEGLEGAVWGDYDNDGCLDLLAWQHARDGDLVLFHNDCDGALVDATVEAGLTNLDPGVDCDADGVDDFAQANAAVWFDADCDGELDLYLANDACGLSSGGVVYRDRFWHNNGDGSFTELSEAWDLVDHDSQGLATVDLARDGHIDLFVSVDSLEANHLLFNEGMGLISERAAALGVQGTYHDGSATWGSSQGAAWGDLDNDGELDLVVANEAWPFELDLADWSNLLISDGVGFVESRDSLGLRYQATAVMPALFDADSDGDLDLLVTAHGAYHHAQFYDNDGEGALTPAAYQAGLVLDDVRGVAAADYDRDGDVDLAVGGLFVNGGENGDFLEVRAVGGAGSNRAAIGATIEVVSGELVQVRQVSGGSGQGVQDSLVQHFGLGGRDWVDRVSVTFTHGHEVVVEDIATNQRIAVYEDGTWEED